MREAFELLERVTNEITGYEADFGLFGELWFRGQADATWALVPGVLRDRFTSSAASKLKPLRAGSQSNPVMDGRIAEQELNSRFRRQGLRHLSSSSSFAQIYVHGQHHGLPTRLLDWTTNPCTALFFASQPPDDRDGAIFLLNPFGWYYYDFYDVDGKKIRRSVITPVQDDDEAFVAQAKYLFKERTPPFATVADGPDASMVQNFEQAYNQPPPPRTLAGVLPVAPFLHDERMAAQYSCFTFHPPDAGDITSFARTIMVPAGLKRELRTTLRTLGVTRATLFGGIDGLATSILDLLAEDIS